MKKEKIVFAAILLPLSVVLSIYLASGLMLLLSKAWTGWHQLKDFGALLDGLLATKESGMIFLCIEGLLAMAILLMIFMGKDKNHTVYESPMRTITDKIKTPIPAGQHQHGSSAWLERAEYRKAFGVFVLDPQNHTIREICQPTGGNRHAHFG